MRRIRHYRDILEQKYQAPESEVEEIPVLEEEPMLLSAEDGEEVE